MMDSNTLALISLAIGVIFNAGGIFWLAMNHMPHVNARLDRLEKNFTKMSSNIAWIRGRLSLSERKR